MTSIFITNTGSPIITDKGEILLCNREAEIKQRIYSILSTQKGSELFDLEYGLDIQTVLETANISSDVVRALVIDALNPSKILGIKELAYVKVTIEDNIVYIDLQVITDYNELVQSFTSLNVGE